MKLSDMDEISPILLETIYNQAMVSITNNRGKIIYVNQQFASITGYSVEELIGQNHRILKSSHHSETFFNVLWQEISHGKSWQGTMVNRRKDGSLYSLHTRIMPVLGNREQPKYYVSIRLQADEL